MREVVVRMPKKKTSTISVQGTPVTILNLEQDDYISLTDMAKARTDSVRAADVIKNWLRTRSTLEFLGTWESRRRNVLRPFSGLRGTSFRC